MLTDLGWDDGFAGAFQALNLRGDAEPGRVAVEFNYLYRVWTQSGELDATVSGRLKHRAERRSELPAVGDWVAIRARGGQDRGAIVAVLPRRSAFSRRMAGTTTDEQIVAANVDVVLIVMGLDDDFSLPRLERYLLLARESGANPVVVLTKPDLCDAVPARMHDAASVAGGVPVHVTNPRLNEGLAPIAACLPAGRTGALLGSSGVGKSTIVNRLVGEDVRRTREVRAGDSKGRHTTMHRELVVLPGGGLVVDTPGMRELQLWDVDDAMRETFEDIEALAAGCRFTDCRHGDEPRCAVKDAVARGALDARRLASYRKVRDELAKLADRQGARVRLDDKRRSRASGRRVKTRRPV